MMLGRLRRYVREELPEPLPWHSRLTIAVGLLTFTVGVSAVIVGLVTLVAIVVGLLTGRVVFPGAAP
jgi:hypothetical protein